MTDSRYDTPERIQARAATVALQRAQEARDPKAIAEARKRLESIQIGCQAQMVQFVTLRNP